jgi:phospholipase C
MSTPGFLAKARQHVTVATSLFALFANLGGPLTASAQTPSTATPIQHVIVIIGENRTFDHVFATHRQEPEATPGMSC